MNNIELYTWWAKKSTKTNLIASSRCSVVLLLAHLHSELLEAESDSAAMMIGLK